MIAVWLLPNKVKEFAETNCEKSGDRGAVGMVPVVSMHTLYILLLYTPISTLCLSTICFSTFCFPVVLPLPSLLHLKQVIWLRAA